MGTISHGLKEVEYDDNLEDLSKASSFLSSLAGKTHEFYLDVFCDCNEVHKHLVNICYSSDQSARVRSFRVPKILHMIWDKERYDEPSLEEEGREYLNSQKEMIFSQLENVLQIEENSAKLFVGPAPDSSHQAIYGFWKIFPEMEKDIYLAVVCAFHPGQLKGEKDRTHTEKILTLEGPFESFLDDAYFLVDPERPFLKPYFSLEQIDDKSTFTGFSDFCQNWFLSKR